MNFLKILITEGIFVIIMILRIQLHGYTNILKVIVDQPEKSSFKPLWSFTVLNQDRHLPHYLSETIKVTNINEHIKHPSLLRPVDELFSSSKSLGRLRIRVNYILEINQSSRLRYSINRKRLIINPRNYEFFLIFIYIFHPIKERGKTLRSSPSTQTTKTILSQS